MVGLAVPCHFRVGFVTLADPTEPSTWAMLWWVRRSKCAMRTTIRARWSISLLALYAR